MCLFILGGLMRVKGGCAMVGCRRAGRAPAAVSCRMVSGVLSISRIPVIVAWTLVAWSVAGYARAQGSMVGAGWTVVPEVVVIGGPEDPRHQLVREAVAYWNEQLAAIGSGFRVGRVRDIERSVPAADLRQLSARMLEGPVGPDAVPPGLRDLPGDIAVVLTDLPLVSFAGPLALGRRVVAVRGLRWPPLDLPNVARNVIAHELGHAIGLLHHEDPALLMCGRPAPCRPELYASPVERFYALSEQDRQALLRLYPPSWEPAADRRR